MIDRIRKYFCRPNCFKGTRGFTLMELLIVIMIMTLIIMLVVSRQKTYTQTAALNNLADKIVLDISRAQLYSVGVKEFIPGSNDFSSSYGVTFSLLEPDSNKSYIYFIDLNDNGYYDGDWTCATGEGLECIEEIILPEGYYINAVCNNLTMTTPDRCTGGPSGISPNRVDITFARPDLTPKFTFDATTPNYDNKVKIKLRDPNNLTKVISIYKRSGLISVDLKDCITFICL